jgi:hypothetical protein
LGRTKKGINKKSEQLADNQPITRNFRIEIPDYSSLKKVVETLLDMLCNSWMILDVFRMREMHAIEDCAT